jgi:crossover junction endodeoxyribonuclease RusA
MANMPVLDVTLPWPPSINHYWGARGRGRYLSPQARRWHKEAWAVLKAQGVRYSGEVAVYVFAHPPDRRKRDLDNITKALLDALVGAGVLKDDYQVARLYAERDLPERPGKVRLMVGEVKRS